MDCGLRVHVLIIQPFWLAVNHYFKNLSFHTGSYPPVATKSKAQITAELADLEDAPY